jgi:predicted adenylyl cyclase CyaB
MERSKTDFSMKNIEIKFQVPFHQEIISYLNHHHDIDFLWSKEQTDIYFQIPDGRLKLRTQSDSASQLIFYQRTNSLEARLSDYLIFSTTETNSLKEILEKALGVKTIIKKKRHLYQFRNVRIHLDEVAELGNFIEFESVLDKRTDEESGRKNLQLLLNNLSSFPLTPIAESYADLIQRNL